MLAEGQAPFRSLLFSASCYEGSGFDKTGVVVLSLAYEGVKSMLFTIATAFDTMAAWIFGGIVTVLLLSGIVGFLLQLSRIRRTQRTRIKAPLLVNTSAVIDSLEAQRRILAGDLVKRLESQKEPFLAELERQISDAIAQQGRHCLDLVEKNRDGTIVKRWPFAPHKFKYVRRMIALFRKTEVNGHIIKAALTDQVLQMIVAQLQQLMRQQNEAVTGDILCNDALDRLIAQEIRHLKSLSMIGDQAKEKAADLVLEQIHHVVEQNTQLAAAGAATAVVASKIATYLFAHFSNVLIPAMAKAIAIPAVQKILLVVAKKFALGAIIAVFSKALAMKLGVSATTVGHVTLGAALVALLTFEIVHFPRQLGNDVARQVRENLDGHYNTIAEESAPTVVSDILENLGDISIETTVQAALQSDEAQVLMLELGRMVANAA